MRGGITSFICGSCLIASGCTTAPQTADIKVRAIPDAAAKLRTGSGVLAEATGQRLGTASFKAHLARRYGA